MSAEDMRRCPRCGSRSRVAEGGRDLEGQHVVAAWWCLLCGHEQTVYDAPRLAYLIDKALVIPGERLKSGPKPKEVAS